MELKEVLENLCYYDKRNPDSVIDDYTEEELTRIKSKRCYCDSCFHGCNKLAEALLKFM